MENEVKKENFDEYFAKVILERCFPEKFPSLTVKDKPDLQYEDKIGVEVTNCMPQETAEAFNLYDKIIKSDGQASQWIYKKLKIIKNVEANKYFITWNQGRYSDDIEHSPIVDFFAAVKKKIEKLNSNTAKYAKMESYELFVNSHIFIPDFLVRKTIACLEKINVGERKYDNIYLITNEQQLLIFDFVNKSLRVKYLYNKLTLFMQKAMELMRCNDA